MKVGIIGGTRGIGKTLTSLLKREECEITITGRDRDIGDLVSRELGVIYSNDNKKIAASSDIVIIAVPMASTKNVINEVAKFMKPGSLLLDVSSVKAETSKFMDEILDKDVEFIPIHPVFGPRITNLNGQVVVLTPLRDKKKNKSGWYLKLVEFLKRHKVRVIESTPEEHDKMMAVVQVLTHFSYISTASAIKNLGIDIKDTRKFASPIYNLMIDMISRIVSQNPFLIYSIQLENENGKKVRQAFVDSVLELKDVLANYDEEKFFEIVMEATKNVGDIQSALHRSDKAIDSQNYEIILLKKSIGKEIALQHIYSNKIYIGILKDINPDFVILDTGKNEKQLKIDNIRILGDKDFFNWKIDNESIKSYSISYIFPKNSDKEVIKNTIKECISDIIDVKIIDIYNDPQINKNSISLTFKIQSFKKSTIQSVEKLLKGFGGIVR